MTVGVLLINLGTPDEPSTTAVRRYLREFLMDGRVVSMPFVVRAALVHLFIAPFRAPKSAHAYQKVWMEEGSPLLVHSIALAEGVRAALGQGYTVALGMRYGNPSMASALAQLSHCERIIVVPLYPQYASATTGTVLDALYRHAAGWEIVPHFSVVPPFYAHPAFIDASAAVAAPHIEDGDFVLFSYHGVPVRQLPCPPCEGATPCPIPSGERANCYRAHCYATTRALVQKLGLSEGQYATSFQSRLGPVEWIRPYTDELVDELAKERGVKRLVVLCPAFVSDCLETLEEIGMELKAQFLEAGGERFVVVPCVNSAPEWVAGTVALIREAGGNKRPQIDEVVSLL